MKTLVFSDTHLTHKFDQKKFDFLHQIISDADKVIINGDFWDFWGTNFEKFFQSEWRHLFPLLKSKQTVYVCGNHDPLPTNRALLEQFCTQAVSEFLCRIGEFNYRFTHGHLLTTHHRSRLGNLYSRSIIKLEVIGFIRPILYFFNSIGEYLFKLLGHQHLSKIAFIAHNNQIMKSLHQPHSDWLCCGDSHVPEVDSSNHYLNSGCILKNHASYLIIPDTGTPQLHYAKY